MKGNSVHESAHSHNENAEHSIMTSSKYLNSSLPNYIYLLIRKTRILKVHTLNIVLWHHNISKIDSCSKMPKSSPNWRWTALPSSSLRNRRFIRSCEMWWWNQITSIMTWLCKCTSATSTESWLWMNSNDFIENKNDMKFVKGILNRCIISK